MECSTLREERLKVGGISAVDLGECRAYALHSPECLLNGMAYMITYRLWQGCGDAWTEVARFTDARMAAQSFIANTGSAMSVDTIQQALEDDTPMDLRCRRGIHWKITPSALSHELAFEILK